MTSKEELRYYIKPYYSRRLGEANEEQKIDGFRQTLENLNLWLTRTGPHLPATACSLELAVLPRNYLCRETGDGLVETEFPLALPILEGMLAFGERIYRSCRGKYRLKSNDQHSVLVAEQACFALDGLLKFVRAMAEQRVVFKNFGWETTPDRHHLFCARQYKPKETAMVRFRPGLFRLEIFYQDANPHGRSLNQFPVEASFRVEPRKPSLESIAGTLELDLSIRQIAAERSKNGNGCLRYTGSVELTDFIFGPNRHHMRIAEGNYEELVAMARETMAVLNVQSIYKTVVDIPK